MDLDPIERLRRFNRIVTAELGALDDSFLGRGRPLNAARVLNAIGRGVDDVSAIRAELRLDSGLMSRLLRALESDGLVETAPDPADGRRRIVRLTAAGRQEFDAYETLSNAQAARVLEGCAAPEKLLDAVDAVALAFGRERIAIAPVDPTDAAARLCLRNYYGELARRFEQGYDPARAADPEAADMRPPRGAFLLARSDAAALGCVALKGGDGAVGEIKRLWVAPEARGMGLGAQLMAAAEAEARRIGFAALRLDTNSALREAARLYERSGWRRIPRYNDDPYPDLFFEKSL